MECSRINELFSEYLDDVLDQSTRRMVEEHLSGCQRCAEELSELRSCLAALGSLDKIKAPTDFLAKVQERIERDERASFLGWLREKLFFPLGVKLPLEVAGLAMAALLVVFIYHGAKQGALPKPGYAPLQSPAPMTEKLDSTAETRAPLQDELSQKNAAPALPSEAPAGDAAPSPAPGEPTVPSQPATGAIAPSQPAAGAAAPRPAPTGVAASKQPSVGAVPSSQALRDTDARQQTSEAAVAAKPMRLVLVIGPSKGAPMSVAERDGRAGGGRLDQPRAVPASPPVSKAEEAASAPAPPARALPAGAPPVAERSAVPSLDQAAGGAAGKDLAKTGGPADTEVERKSLKAAVPARESKPSVDKAKKPGASASREATGSMRSPGPLGPQQALAEIKSFVQGAGGRIEAVKQDDATGQPESLTIRVPAQSFPSFLDLLGRIGQLRSRAETRVRTSDSEPILVQITFELAP